MKKMIRYILPELKYLGGMTALFALVAVIGPYVSPASAAQHGAPGTNSTPESIVMPMEGCTSLFIWKDTETNGFLMDGQVVVTMKKPMDVAEGESIQVFLMTDGHEMTGIIINKINGQFVFTDRATGLILWKIPNQYLIGP